MPGPGYTSPSTRRGKQMVKDFALLMHRKAGAKKGPTEKAFRGALKREGKIVLRPPRRPR